MASTRTRRTPTNFSSSTEELVGAPMGDRGRAAVSPCAECLTVPAACRCIKCECLLCLSCFEEVHRASKYMRKHEYELLGPKDPSRNCDRHVDRAVEYYCVQDRTPVCSHCVVMGDHKSHDVYLLEEAAQRLMDDATRLSEEASTLLQRYNDLLVSTSSLISSSHSHETKLVNELKEHFENIFVLLRSRHEKLERDVLIASEDHLRTLKELYSKTAARKKEIEMIVAEVGGLERSQVVFHANLLQQLEDALQDEEIIASDSLDLVQLNLDATRLQDLLAMHGDILAKRQNLPISENLPCLAMENGNQTISTSKLENNQSDSPIVGPFAIRNQCSLSPPPVKRMIDFPSAPISFDTTATSFPAECSSQDSKNFAAVNSVNNDFHLWSKRCLSDNSKSGSCIQLSSVTGSSSDVSSSSESSCHMSAKATVSDFNGSTAENQISSRSSSTGRTRSVPPGFSKLPRIDDISQSWRNGVMPSNGFSSLDSSSRNLSFSGHMEPVMISHVSHPGLFWVHLSKDMEKLGRLSQDIQDYCNGNCKPNEKLMAKGFKEGDLVFAKFQDDVWYRAEVMSRRDFGDGHVLGVHSIDYGRDDVVALGRVEAVRPNFLKIPQLVYLCSLADVRPIGGDEWSAEATKLFQQMVSNVPMMMRISTQVSNMFHVRLSWPLKEDVSDDQLVYVGDALVFHELAMYANPEANLPNHEKCLPSRYIKPIIPKGGRVIPVIITKVFSPHLFYVQVQQMSSYFLEMMEEIQDACEDNASNTLNLFLPFVGMSCLVMFPKQGQWCRSEVIELLGGGKVKVSNVDFGGTEIVNVIQIKKLPDRFVVLPAQAVRCTLADVDLIGDSSDAAASSFLSDIATQTVFINIKEASSGPLLSVYLSKDPEFSPESLVNFLLISNGLAVASVKGAGTSDSNHNCLMSSSNTSLHDELNMKVSGQKESKISKLPSDLASTKVENIHPHFVAELPTLQKRRALTPSAANSQRVCISHFVTPDEFYIQVAAAKNLSRLMGLMQELNAEYQHSHPDASRFWGIGDECVAQYSADGCWYRAKIIGIDEDRVEVLCRDYGYRGFLHRSNLQRVDARFMRDPWYSICCHLVDLVPSNKSHKWSSETCEILRTMFVDKVCHVDIKDFTTEGSLPVDILFLETVKGTALKPDYSLYVSLTDWLLENGHAMLPGSTVEHLNTACSDEDISNNICDRINGLDESQAVLESEGLDVDIGKSYLSYSMPPGADYQPPEYPSSETFLLVVTSVDEDFCIYGQEAKADLTFLRTLMDRVQSRYHCTMPEASSQVWTLGQPVASQFTEDNMFYRARIMGFNESGIEVKYVDWGNREVVRKERLRLMDQTFLSIPIQCLSCCLYDVDPPTSQSGKWSSDAIRSVNALLYNKACKVTVRARDAVHSRVLVDLQLPDGRDLASVLKEDRFAINEDLVENSDVGGCNSCVHSISKRLAGRVVPSPYHQMALPTVGDLLHVIVTEIERPTVLYMQHVLMEDTDSEASQIINDNLKRLEALSVEYSNSIAAFERLNKTEIHSGTACVAQYSSDKCWYRAEIIEVRGETEVGVRFVDYGSSDFLSAEKLCAIPAEHMVLPAQCWRCRLHGLDILSIEETYVTDVVQKLTRLFANQSLIALVKNVLSDGVLDVGLYGRKHYLEAGTLGPLLYQSLIDEGLFCLADNGSDEGVVLECQEDVINIEESADAVPTMTIS